MKTAWKWNTVATLLVAVSLALQAGLIWFAVDWMMPSFKQLTQTSRPIHWLPTRTFSLVETIVLLKTYVIVLLALAWGGFEWRAKSENKALMRLTGGLALSVALGTLAFVVCAGLLLSFAFLPR